MNNPEPRPPGVTRAAILFVLLGEEAAELLAPHLTQREVASIAREVAGLGRLSPERAAEVLADCRRDALGWPAGRGGQELARRMLSLAEIPDDLSGSLLGPAARPGDRAFGPLLEARPEVLAAALHGEHPQTVALVLLHLPPRRAAATLHRLPEAEQAETLSRMAGLGQVKDELLGEVAQSLRQRLGELGGMEQPSDGLERAAEVLHHLPRTGLRGLLDALEEGHPGEADRLRQRVFTFESLAAIDDRGMQGLLRQISTQVLALALRAGPESLCERFLANLSERARGTLLDEIDLLGDVSEIEQQLARKEIVDAALRLETEGELVFRDAEDAE